MKKKILIVDDDHICNFLTQKILKRLSIVSEVYTALNGLVALDFISNENDRGVLPDVILLDLNMPVMDGFAFLEAFNQSTSIPKEKIVIIIVSSSQNPDDVKRAMALGVDYYLTKPLAIEELKNILKLLFD